MLNTPQVYIPSSQDISINDDDFIVTTLENQLRRLSHYQAMPLPRWLAD